MSSWVDLLISIAAALVVTWLGLIFVLARSGLGRAGLTEAPRFLPDLLRLVSRFARDPALPRGLRVRLWLLLGYLASPIDLIPDFLPVVGYADDAIIVALVLRSVVRRSGAEALERHWPGSSEGLGLTRRLAGLGISGMDEEDHRDGQRRQPRSGG